MRADRIATLSIRLRTGETIEVQASFPKDEWHALTRFTEYADQLLLNPIGRHGCEISFKIIGAQQSGLQYEVGALPGDNELAAFLHRLRPFVLQDDLTEFGRVAKILSHRLAHPVARAILDRHRALFAGKDFQRRFTITINDLVINSEKALRLWLYGFEYHHDEDKRAALEGIAPAMSLDAARAIFLNLMLDKSKAVREVAHLIRVLIRSADCPS